jgi:hypothetical protein
MSILHDHVISSVTSFPVLLVNCGCNSDYTTSLQQIGNQSGLWCGVHLSLGKPYKVINYIQKTFLWSVNKGSVLLGTSTQDAAKPDKCRNRRSRWSHGLITKSHRIKNGLNICVQSAVCLHDVHRETRCASGAWKHKKHRSAALWMLLPV